jgi:CHAD domain-containing protein
MIEALDVNCKRNERRSFRHLARIRKRAGKIRDMDVLTGYASTVQVEEGRDCLVQLLEYLGAERYRRAEQLHALIRKYGAELRRRLKRTLAHVQKSIPGHSKKGARIRNTAADAMAFVLKLFNELAVPATLNRNNLHAYRLKIKQLRYVLEMADDPGNQAQCAPAFADAMGGRRFCERLRHGNEEEVNYEKLTVDAQHSTSSSR